jgi:selenide,water dikinase
VTACTDITGYGFLGHAMEMAGASRVTMEIDFRSMPVMPEAYDMLRAEAIAGGLWANKKHVAPNLVMSGLTEEDVNILCDPQTSGGLLLTVPAANAGKALRMLHIAGAGHSSLIGKVLAKGRGRIIVRG